MAILKSKIWTPFFMSLLIGFLLFSYFPVIYTPYLFHDDFFAYALRPINSNEPHPQSNAYFNNFGRPIGFWIKYFLESRIHQINDSVKVRMLSLFLIVSLSLLIFLWFKKTCFSPIFSLFLTVLILTLPPFQLTVVWISNSHHLVGAIFSTLALWCLYPLFQSKIEASTSQFMSHFRLRSRMAHELVSKIIPISMASVLLIVSHLIYQPAALFNTALMPSILLGESRRNQRRSLIIFLSTHLLSFFVCFIYLKTLPSERAKLVSDISGKAIWFFKEILPRMFSFWGLSPDRGWAFLFCFFLVAGLFFSFSRLLYNHQTMKRLFRLFFFLIFFVPFSFLPNLLTHEKGISYRAFIAIQSLLLGVTIIFLRECFHFLYPKLHRILNHFFLVSLAGVITLYTNQTVNDFYTQPLSMEFKAVKSHLEKMIHENYLGLHIVQKTRPKVVLSNDEYGPLTTSFEQDLMTLIVAALRELYTVEETDRLIHRYAFSLGKDKHSVYFPEKYRGMAIPKEFLVLDMDDMLNSS